MQVRLKYLSIGMIQGRLLQCDQYHHWSPGGGGIEGGREGGREGERGRERGKQGGRGRE